MSYILDALKRADAERERGAVPGLHARQINGPVPQAARRMPPRAWLAVAGVTLAALAGAGLWVWQTPDAEVRVAAVQPAAPKPPATVPLAQPAPVVIAPTAGASQPSLPVPQAAAAASRPAPRPAASGRAVAAPPQPRVQPASVAREAPGPATPPAVRSFKDLPEDLRRQIPPLAITGSVYSKNPDQRLLLVNNQVLSRGALAAPEVMLEDIQAKSSVFSFQGTRFRVAH